MYRQNERDIACVRQTDIDQVRYSELVLKLANSKDLLPDPTSLNYSISIRPRPIIS